MLPVASTYGQIYLLTGTVYFLRGVRPKESVCLTVNRCGLTASDVTTQPGTTAMLSQSPIQAVFTHTRTHICTQSSLLRAGYATSEKNSSSLSAALVVSGVPWRWWWWWWWWTQCEGREKWPLPKQAKFSISLNLYSTELPMNLITFTYHLTHWKCSFSAAFTAAL